MSGYNDYNENTIAGGNSGQKYETPCQTGTGNDGNTMSGLGGDQSRTGYASAGAAGPTADNMNSGGFNETQGSGGDSTGLGNSERTGMGYQGSSGDSQDGASPETGRFSEPQGYSTGNRDNDNSGFNTTSGGAQNYGRGRA